MRNVQQAIQMVRDGSTVKEAGRLCKVPTTTLRSHLCRLGVQSKWQYARHFNFSQKEKIRELRKLGLSYLDISKKTKVNEESVRTWCADIVLTDKQIKENLGVDFEKKKKAIALRKSGRYVGEIANELNCSKSSVCSWVADYIKETGQDIDKKARARKKREDAAKSGADQVSLKKVVAQRKKGYSAKEIAGKLGVSPYVIKIALEQHVFSHDERAEIEKKAVLRLRERRAAGEIKAAGGVREGSGRSKSGYYKGIYCGSSYELCWVIYALDHQIGFSRFSETLKKGGVTYIPDFLLADGVTIVELKGYEREGVVAKKTAVAESFGYTVKVLRKDDLEFAFEHVKKYGVTVETCYTLYDGYKPKYALVCSSCQKEFQRDRKCTKNCVEQVVFCNRSCS